MPVRSFPLAKMSPLFGRTTAVSLGIIALFTVAALVGQPRGMWLPAALLGAMTAGVWVYARPTRFEVSPAGVAIVWPVRRRVLLRSAIARVRIVDDTSAFRAEFGRAVRIGVGGLFGTFGLLKTSERGLVQVYVSTTARWVLIEPREGRPLLISPARPDEFVRLLAPEAAPL